MTPPTLTSPVVSLSSASFTPPTSRVLSVVFHLNPPSSSSCLPDGDLTILFPSTTFPDQPEPASAASVNSGTYHHLTRSEPSSAASYTAPWITSTPSIPEGDESASPSADVSSPTDTTGPPTARQPTFNLNIPVSKTDFQPLSTARLLEHENAPRFTDLAPTENEGENLWDFFRTRPVVQAPAQIPVSERVEVLFLLSTEVEVPDVAQVLWRAAWTGEETVLGEIHSVDFKEETGLERRWGERRLADLGVLREVARELEEEGKRGEGVGRVKVGVEGGGMDEEAVRREGWMVGEEVHWVLEEFLGGAGEMLAGGMSKLGLAGEHEERGVIGGKSKEVEAAEESEEEEALFAMPLSPRSDAKNAFAMFKREREPVEISPLAQVLNG